MKICKWFEDKVYDYVDGLLPGERKKEVEIHFKECSSCLSAFNDIMNIRVQLRHLHSFKTSPDFETVLRTRISMERSLKRSRNLNWPVRIPIFAATGAFVVFAAFFALGSLKDFRTNNSNDTALIAPSYRSNQNISNYSSAFNRNLPQNINYPMDWVNISGRGTPINSTELERFSTTRTDSANEITPREVFHHYEF